MSVCEILATRFEEDWGGFGEKTGLLNYDEYALALAVMDAGCPTIGARRCSDNKPTTTSWKFDVFGACAPTSRTRILRKLCLATTH